jgi:hypothetical protein
VKSLVLRDRQANVLVIAEAAFALPASLAELAAAQIMKFVEGDRAGILLYSAGLEKGTAQEIVAAVMMAASELRPASVQFDGTRVSVAVKDNCVASLFPLAFGGRWRVPGDSESRDYRIRRIRSGTNSRNRLPAAVPAYVNPAFSNALRGPRQLCGYQ